MSTGIMSSSYTCHNFLETNAMFLEFEDALDNFRGGSSSVGDNARSFSQQLGTPTPRRLHGRIPMVIAPGVEKPIFPHVVRFSQTIGVCVRKTFPVRCLKWADSGREYIKIVKGDL
uniref:CACTA en-spm transposon protein n=1 Tax=Cucumis melo TaxID=3656 RepID=A0A9I9EH78_CUCME